MSGRRHGIATCLAGIALMATGSAHGSDCWDAPSVGAARISELETMLMVVSLRCRAKGFDFHDSYERFAENYKAAFSAAQVTLKTHFGASGSEAGHRAYDSYLIGIANFYGTGKTDADTCHAFKVMNEELGGAAANPDLLPVIALEMVPDPRVAGAKCPPAQVQAVAGR